ncbi:MAG TPA: universal stress protein [Acidimicrobiia bacterium]|nr:universal stress protein [Acidimicrobiia bacterium]
MAFLVLAAWLAIGTGAALIMRRKGHDAFSWAILFFFLGPLAIPLAVSAHRHPPQDGATRDHGGALDVLVAYDGSPAASAALAAALELFDSRMTSLTLAAIVDIESASTVSGHDTERDVQARLDRVAGEITLPCGPVETVILHGDPGHVLARCAAADGYELVVVPGSDGHRWRRMLTGDGTHRVPSATPVPVLVGPVVR